MSLDHRPRADEVADHPLVDRKVDAADELGVEVAARHGAELSDRLAKCRGRGNLGLHGGADLVDLGQ